MLLSHTGLINQMLTWLGSITYQAAGWQAWLPVLSMCHALHSAEVCML